LVEIKKGLEDVFVLETKISSIDGIKGILKYRGIDIHDLSHLSYDAVSYLLIHGKIPDEKEISAYSHQLKKDRGISEEMIRVLHTCNFNIEAMDALRTEVSYMAHCDPDMNDNFHRIRNNQEIVAPDPHLSHGANFLYMLRGTRPGELEAELMEADFILSAEHELNTSTFSTRVTASTLSDLHSAIISGLSTLKGPLHGGARMAVMEMLDEISTPEHAEEYVLNLISNKQRVMGFGHRVYKTYDPRAKISNELAKKIAEEKHEQKWYEIAQNIENTVNRELVEKRGKPIYPNVDFYVAVIYRYLGITPLLATSVFAIGRVSGWIAHILEQYADNRLIRPRAKFVR
jgi:citrate synthase